MGASRLPRPLGEAWRWWCAELAPMFAPSIDKYWADHENKLTLALDEHGALPVSLSTAKISGKEIKLLLAPASVLEKIVTYPAQVEENLTDVVENDIDRQTPFTASQVYVAHRLVRRHEGSDGVARVDVAITVARKKMLDQAIDAVHLSGGRVVSVGVANDLHHAELLPESARPARRLSTLQKINLSLFVSLIGLIVVAVVAPIWMKRSDVMVLNPLVGDARLAAESTRKIEAEYQRLQQENAVAVNKKYANYQVIDILDDLTKRSPDTTWLQVFELKTLPLAAAAKNSATAAKPAVREIRLEGEAASAAKMIELIEQSPYLQNTTQRAQTTRGAQPNTEFFRLSTEIKPRVAPTLVDLLAPPETLSPPPPAPSVAVTSGAPLPIAIVTPVPSAPPTPSYEKNDKSLTKDARKDAMKDAQKELNKAPVKNAIPLPVPSPPPTSAPLSAPTTVPAKPASSAIEPLVKP